MAQTPICHQQTGAEQEAEEQLLLMGTGPECRGQFEEELQHEIAIQECGTTDEKEKKRGERELSCESTNLRQCRAALQDKGLKADYQRES